MAATSSSAPSDSLSRQRISAGRSKIVSPVPRSLYSHSSKGQTSSAQSAAKEHKHQQQDASLSLATRLNALDSGVSDEARAGAQSSSSVLRSERSECNSIRAALPSIDTTNMSSYTSTTTASPTPKSGHAKLHKRHSSGSSLPSSPPTGAHGVFNTPFATQEAPFANVGTSSGSTSSTPKIKPYLRKMSGAKEMDQGKLDLSKPVSENERLAGLGIHDFGTRSVSDVTFAHAGKRGTHARTISVGSQASAGSTSFRPTQPFVHPMRQTPRPYETLAGSSNASIVDEEEARESLDVVRDDFRSQPFRNKRSMSISSNLPGMPTPLSQSHTVDHPGSVPKLTNSESLTNLSIVSGQSSKSRKGRSRRNTDQTMDVPTPSSRTSFDRAFSFVSRPPDPEPQTRDERIREERRKFQQKEASKDMKREREAAKRREAEQAKNMKSKERQRRKSEAEERAKLTRSLASTDSASKILPKRSKTVYEEKQDGVLHSRSYQDSQPSLVPPRQGVEAGMSEKIRRASQRKSKSASGGWVRFNAWFQTRMLSCGGQR